MNNLDSLFNDKLANHSMAPSEAAWERINARLSKKNNGTTWLRWAAVLIPAMMLSGLIWWSRTTPSAEVLVNESTQPAPTPVTHEQVKVTTEPTPIASTAKPGKADRNPVTNTTSAPMTEKVAALAPTKEALPEVPTFNETTIEPIQEAAPAVAAASKPIVLVYTLPSIESSTPPEDAAVSSLGRVVEFANTVKHSDPLGDLRVMKAELFALDLRKKSSKKN